jgi:hypothetical protein
MLASMQPATNPRGTRYAPAGGLADDVRAELRSEIEYAARTAADEIKPTVRESLSDPEFGRNMGVGVVQELRKPESGALIDAVGRAAGREIARYNPVVLTVGALGVFAVGVAAGYLIAK